VERIPADTWHLHAGHVERYRYAATKIHPGERVNDVACGVGYGAALLGPVDYHGYDRPGVYDARFGGTFHPADLNDPGWLPELADATVCFETLEHVLDPAVLAHKLATSTRRVLLVSVPTEPTRHLNPWHLHDFSVEDIPPMFAGFQMVERWAQPTELSHVWLLERLEAYRALVPA
jgi:2-polyprenyl-3-methyl-5-hydroxy-6-metoxy-1,4-benzoquinol methylase